MSSPEQSPQRPPLLPQNERLSSPDDPRFPAPADIVKVALAEIQSDGTVLRYAEPDPENDEPGGWYNAGYPPVDTDFISDERYAADLMSLTRVIFHTAEALADHPEERDEKMASLSEYLTAYYHDPNFIELAISLIPYDAETLEPKYPNPPPTPNLGGWARRLRTQLKQRSVLGKTPKSEI